MDIKKIVLYLAVALLGVMIWNTWQKDYPPPAVQHTETKTAKKAAPENFTPPAYDSKKGTSPSSASTESHKSEAPSIPQNKGSVITINTDVLALKVGEIGGNFVSARLLKYPAAIHEKNNPIRLFNDNPQELYLAQSGITNGVKLGQVHFSASQKNYTLPLGQKQLVVTLKGKTKTGLVITKRYTLKQGSYAVTQSIEVSNQSSKTWSGSFFYQFTQKDQEKHSYFSRSYTGAAISTPQNRYQKLSYKKLNKQNVDKNIIGGWVALQQPYFLSAWIPAANQENHYYSKTFGEGTKAKGKTFILGYVGSKITLKPGQSIKNQATLFVGPELSEQLKATAPGLDLTIDYGWLWFLSKPIFWVMAKIHSVVGNWGWTIILVTLLIKAVFYKLSEKSYRSMAKMKAVGPRLQALKERHAGDKQGLGKATMEFYKREKVNPMGGCLPMLIQIPVFIALYYVLIESVQLRQAPFIFWIHDLSVKDPYYVLPILMGLTMFLQQRLSPPPPDPTQAKMMMLLPVVFTVFFLSFPAGLVLYWLTNNCLSISQQWYIMKTYDPKAEKHKKKRKKKNR